MNREELNVELDKLATLLVAASVRSDFEEYKQSFLNVLNDSFLAKLARERSAGPVPVASSRPMSERKGEGGRLRLPGNQLDGMLVDLSNVYADGSLEVVLSMTRGEYREGARFHVTVWEYEKMWDGTV